jgi:hypothetical protein
VSWQRHGDEANRRERRLSHQLGVRPRAIQTPGSSSTARSASAGPDSRSSQSTPTPAPLSDDGPSDPNRVDALLNGRPENRPWNEASASSSQAPREQARFPGVACINAAYSRAVRKDGARVGESALARRSRTRVESPLPSGPGTEERCGTGRQAVEIPRALLGRRQRYALPRCAAQRGRRVERGRAALHGRASGASGESARARARLGAGGRVTVSVVGRGRFAIRTPGR